MLHDGDQSVEKTFKDIIVRYLETDIPTIEALTKWSLKLIKLIGSYLLMNLSSFKFQVINRKIKRKRKKKN